MSARRGFASTILVRRRLSAFASLLLLALLAACTNEIGAAQPGSPSEYNNDEFTGDSNQSGSQHHR
jgi:hypothetical protein